MPTPGTRSSCRRDAPATIVKKLNDAAVEAMNTPAVKREARGPRRRDRSRRAARRRQYLAKFVKSEIEKWAAPIKASGVTVD